MTKEFADAKMAKIFQMECSKGSPVQIFKSALRKLYLLNTAETLNSMAFPAGNRLHALSGDRKGQHAVSINAQYRLCFEWRKDGVYKVEITDYH